MTSSSLPRDIDANEKSQCIQANYFRRAGRHTTPVASAEKLAIISLMSYRGILRTLLVRGGKQELPSQHQSVARASLHMPAAQYQPNNSTSASWAWPCALGEPEVAHGRSHAVAAWRRGGGALLLCFCGARPCQHFQQPMDVDRALPMRRLRTMGARVPVASERVPATSRLRCASPPREPLDSFACLVRQRRLQLGMEQSNVDVEAACLARRTWRLLAVLFVLCSRAFSYLANESCARGFACHEQEKDATKVGLVDQIRQDYAICDLTNLMG